MRPIISRITLAAVVSAVGFSSWGCGGITDSQAQQWLMGNLGNTTVTVFPAFSRRGKTPAYEDRAALEIAAFLESDGLAEPTVSNARVPITGPWHGNQAKMLRESAQSFVTYLSENPVETEYALLPEYLFGRSEAGGVHCYIVDRDGKIAHAVLLNSHHMPFSKATPKTAEDCTKVLIGVLRGSLKRETVQP